MYTEIRRQAFFALCAFALLGGIVLHSITQYVPSLNILGLRIENSRNVALPGKLDAIEVLQMTLFFLVAGFLAHFIFHRNGITGFVRDRAKHVLIPLLIGGLFVGLLGLAMLYIAPGSTEKSAAHNSHSSMHLWFSYYLLMFYGAVLSVRHYCVKWLDRDGNFCAYIDGRIRSLILGNAAPAFLSVPLAVCLYFQLNRNMPSASASFDTAFFPSLSTVVGFGTAFVFGWLLDRQSELLAVWKRRCFVHIALAIALSAASAWIGAQFETQNIVAAIFIKMAYVGCYVGALWNWIVGLIGAALRFFSEERAHRNYFSDASHWLHLLHLPLSRKTLAQLRDKIVAYRRASHI